MGSLTSHTAWLIIVACIAVAFFIAATALPYVSDASIYFPSAPNTPIETKRLPFELLEGPQSQSAIATMSVRNTLLSDGQFAATYDDCLESLRVNGKEVLQVKLLDDFSRCRWWKPLAIDLWSYLVPGNNQIVMTVKNSGGDLRAGFHGLYSRTALFGIVASFSVALFVWLFLQPRCVFSNSKSTSAADAFLLALFLPVAGTVYLALVVDAYGVDGVGDRAAVLYAAILVPFMLALRVSLRRNDIVLRREFSPSTLIASLFCFACAAYSIETATWNHYNAMHFAVLASLLGVAVFQPKLTTTRGPFLIAAVAALCPIVYLTFNLPAWKYASVVTGKLVQAFLWFCGISTTSFSGEKRDNNGMIEDYFVQIHSPEFSIRIASWCSGMEGVLLFVFLFSCFFLFDWPFFSRAKRLWPIYLATIFFVFLVNIVRITGIFLYAVGMVSESGRTAAVHGAVEAFHSNIGWIMYSVAFGIALPFAYKWVRSSTASKSLPGGGQASL